MKEFESLLEYYRKCFELIDVFHFNSTISQKQFQRILNIDDSRQEVLSITHDGIQDNREKKSFDNQILRLGFIGHESPYKGLPLLKKQLASIDKSKWRLDVWGGRIGQENDMPVFFRGKFDNSTIKQVFHEMDLLVVPSIWKETFGLVTLEALSYGVPVLVSNNVGAQDIVREYAPSFVYTDESELLSKIKKVIYDRTELYAYNAAILKQKWRHSMTDHAREIVDKIYKQ